MNLYLQTLLFGLITVSPALTASDPTVPPPAPAFANGALLRIMPLGDSITQGSGSTNSNGYHKRLVSELEKTTKASMIGTNHDGDFAAPDGGTRS
ncbi:hypothetical protein PgNI_10877 [Pyricularia grisea]|uniref:SGNH hydrolase-type esterase domain-containing protein n=1 Tax=Pyricularia grisea TaxID=148305 RepID=A0A6P8AZ17_PYRGI|nr:hypothetical protein PgNI_10877 [Pyricularia grisea]TLD07491.1 hypothetical protein PgNI_10877 [Pyricularia grisea]